MLILTRWPRQRLKIGQNITITIHSARGKIARIGIEAPQDCKIKTCDKEKLQ